MRSFTNVLIDVSNFKLLKKAYRFVLDKPVFFSTVIIIA